MNTRTLKVSDIMMTIIRKERYNPSSNPGRGYLPFPLRKSINPNFPPKDIGKLEKKCSPPSH